MATITNSVLVNSEPDTPGSGLRRNVYRYTLDDATVHDVRVLRPATVTDADDMAAHGAYLLEQLVQTEIDAMLGGA